MLKKQLLSNRPMTKKSMKVNKVHATTPPTNPNVINATTQKFGVGRGKDISITAKHFNSAKSSDNSDRDNTDNDTNINLDVESGSEGESEESIQVTAKMEKSDSKITKDSQNSAEVVTVTKDGLAEICPAVNGNHSKSICKVSTNGPGLVDNADFAKAISVDAKEKMAKVKPTKRDDFKKSSTEQPLKRAPILINAAHKFKTNCLNKTIVANVVCRPFAELRTPNGNAKRPNAKSLTCAKPETKLPKIPQRRQMTDETKIDENSADDAKMEIDVVTVDDAKSDAATTASTKKKLNIQEYLKRKNISAMPSGKVKISREEHSYGKPVEMAPKPAQAVENGHVQANEKSLYEEIISVSMGCCTDISIPALLHGVRCDGADASAASKSTELLSNIQTTIEMANSGLEQGKISSSSLISSIQDVILKKTSIKIERDEGVHEKNGMTAEDGEIEHGENKVIMHLRKDRIRPTTVTLAIQTDPYFRFLPLERLASHSRKNEHFDRCKSLGRSSSGNNIANDVRSRRAYSIQRDRFTKRIYRKRKDLSESAYYSNDDEDDEQLQMSSSPQRRSRHSDYLESIAHPSPIANGNGKLRRKHKRSGSFKNNRKYRASKLERDSNRHRTISRSLSQSSDTSSTSDGSTSTSSSASTDSSSSSSSKSLNSYGDSSTKSYYGDEQYNRRPNRSNQNWLRARNQQLSSHRSNSPGKCHPLQTIEQFN